MLDLVSKACSDEAFFTKVTSLVEVLAVCFQKLHFLGDVGDVLVILPISVDVSEEAPVI